MEKLSLSANGVFLCVYTGDLFAFSGMRKVVIEEQLQAGLIMCEEVTVDTITI